MAQLSIQQMFELAVQHHQAGRLHAAEQLYRQILAQQPEHFGALHYLGVIAHQAGRQDVAEELIGKAIAANPHYPEAYSNLGQALNAAGKREEAMAAYRQAIALNPTFPEAHNNLGIVLKESGQMDQAIAAYRQALALRPNHAEAHYNLGMVLRDKGLLDEAEAEYRQAVALRPTWGEAHNNLGNVLKDKGQLDEALAAYRQALAVQPDYAEAHSNLILNTHYQPGFDGAAIAAELGHWNRQHAEPLTKFIHPHGNDRNPDRRLRIGYVSPDFRKHPVGMLLLPVLAHHDHQAVEIFGYAQVPDPDAMTDRLRRHTDGWRSLVGLKDAAAADLIRQDRIDILVDLALHTAQSRLLIFAHKPAPVQVTYLAYAGSSGLATMDYRLSDPYLDPPETDEAVYSEQTIRLPETYWCYQPLLNPPLQPPPAVEKGFVTFGCLNNFCKVNEPLLDLWARLLGAVPHSRLLLHAHEGSHRQRVQDHWQRHGIAPERITFAGRAPLAAYFAQYQSIDIALDTHPYGGGTTTCDALWMGAPVISLAGNTAVGRGGMSLLSNIGLPELVAHTPEQYVQIAANLATDLPRLTQLRSTIRQRMQQSPLMDGPRFARNVEAAYRQMWRKWCATCPT